MNNYSYTLLVSIAFIFLLTNCKSDPPVLEVTTKLNLNYRATYGNEPLVMGQWFPYGDSINIQFTTFDFYVSDVTLLRDVSPNSDGSEIKEIDLLDFSNIATPPAATAGLNNLIDNVPIGDYQGVRMGVGVPSDLNRTRPIEYAPNHPLRRDDRYQSNWESYIFAVIAGRYDSNNDGIDDGTFSYEVGTDDFYQKIAIIQGIDVLADDTPNLNFKIDVSKLLGTNSNRIDIVGQPTDENMKFAERISENFTVALTLE